MKKCIALLLTLMLLTGTFCGCRKENTPAASGTDTVVQKSYTDMTAEEIVATMTLEEKACQMVIPAIYNAQPEDMAKHDYGSILSTYGFVEQDAAAWRKIISDYQDNALKASAPIPFIYGQDSVHGVNYALDTVIFPQNVNIGCVNDDQLVYQMGLAVADEQKLTGLLWNYGPCVAVAEDPRWGRTYESYSSDPAVVKTVGTAFTKGLLDGGVVVCAKHYIADGSVEFGTGETSFDGQTRLIDRGNAIMSDAEIEAQLAIYKSLIDEGVQSIMISHSALNGVKMHENAHYITDVLRDEFGFEGVIVSDWESIQNIDSTKDYKQQVITAINAGIDWLMEPAGYEDCITYICEAVNEGTITQQRVDDAVTRIIKLKKDAGLFEDPYLEKIETKQTETGSQEYRDLACKLVEKSQVLIKNENNILPLKKGMKLLVVGQAANDTGVQCGGWTRQWNGLSDKDYGDKLISGATTILEGIEAVADEYDLTILTNVNDAEEADAVLLVLGEEPYAEWNGDTADLSVTGSCAIVNNGSYIKAAEKQGKPIITLLVTGRNVIIDDYKDNWDAIVMCGLFGSEGQGVVNVLTGKSDFTGRLAMPWYASTKDIDAGKPWLDIGYGLSYAG